MSDNVRVLFATRTDWFVKMIREIDKIPKYKPINFV